MIAILVQCPERLFLVSSDRCTLLLVRFRPPIHTSLAMRHPVVGEPVGFKEFIRTPWKDMFPGRVVRWESGCSGLGRLLLGSWNNRLFVGSACDWFYDCVECACPCSNRYVLSQSSPFVTSLYSIFLWKEFKGASKKTWTLEILMLMALASSMVLLCFAKSN